MLSSFQFRVLYSCVMTLSQTQSCPFLKANVGGLLGKYKLYSFKCVCTSACIIWQRLVCLLRGSTKIICTGTLVYLSKQNQLFKGFYLTFLQIYMAMYLSVRKMPPANKVADMNHPDWAAILVSVLRSDAVRSVSTLLSVEELKLQQYCMCSQSHIQEEVLYNKS